MSIKSGLYVALACVAAGASSTRAASLYLSNVAPDASMTVTFPGLSAQTTPYVGQINWTFNRSDSSNTHLDTLVTGTSLSTFCIEGTQDVYIGQTSNFANILTDISQAPQDNVGSIYKMGSAKAASINQFWDAYYGQATTSTVNAAAFQLGIWEILYDSTPDLTADNFVAAPTSDADSIKAFSEAQTWLGNYTSVTPTAYYQLYALSDPYLQDQLFGVQVAGPNIPSTPLPAALPAGLGLLGGLLAFRKMRRATAL